MQVCRSNKANVPHDKPFHLEHVWESTDIGQVRVREAGAHLKFKQAGAVVQKFQITRVVWQLDVLNAKLFQIWAVTEGRWCNLSDRVAIEGDALQLRVADKLAEVGDAVAAQVKLQKIDKFKANVLHAGLLDKVTFEA